MLDLYFWSVVVFFAVIAVLLFENRRKIDSHYYILYMYRTKRFRNFIDSVANISPRGWKAVYTLAVVVCFVVMASGFCTIIQNDYNIIMKSEKVARAALILPTPSSEGSAGPGYILIPFWYWIIVIACILVPHELSHGIIARAEKIPLKSVGLMLFAIFPGAFVEPDEKAVQRRGTMAKLRLFAAGSFANFVVAGLVLSLMVFVVWPSMAAPSVTMELTSINASSPAEQAGLVPGMVITEINGKAITTNYLEYLLTGTYIADEMGKVAPGSAITVTADGKELPITLGENPETKGPYMGVLFNYSKAFTDGDAYFLASVEPLIRMIWMFSFFVGLFNVLPLVPLDGGLMVQAVAERYVRRHRLVVRLISMVTLVSIVLMFIGPNLMVALT